MEETFMEEVKAKNEMECQSNPVNINIEVDNYNDLSNKIEEARITTKGALVLCQQIFLHSNNPLIYNKNQHFDDVAGPLVNAMELFSTSLNALQDISQLEEKYEINSDELIVERFKRKSLTPVETIAKRQCFVKLENLKDIEINHVKNEDLEFNNRKSESYDSRNDFDSNEDSFTTNCDIDDNDIDIDNQDNLELKPKKQKRNKSRAVNYNEDENELTEENKSKKLIKQNGRNIQLKCDNCNFTTTQKFEYNQHIRGSLSFRKCPWCPQIIRTGEIDSEDWYKFRKKMQEKDKKSAEQQFTEHMNEDHPDLRTAPDGFLCKECKQSFSSVTEYDKHFTEEHNLGYTFHCKAKCGFSTTNLSIAKNHYREVHYRYCKICPINNRFKTIQGLEAHYLEKHTRATCDICKEEFDSRHVLNKHLRDQHDRIPEGWSCCSVCGKICRSIRSHMDYKHKNKHSEKFLCHLCPYMGTESLLRAHKLNKHSGKVVKTFSCDYCAKTFITPSYMKKHIANLHLKQEKTICPEPGCEHEVLSKKGLKTHIDFAHKGIRHYCTFTKCDFVANYEYIFKEHIKVVHEGRTYDCEKCEFKAQSGYLLKKHLKDVHSEGVFTLECEICKFKTRDRFNLNEHISHVHKGESYKCTLCAKPSLHPKKSSFSQHLKRVHKTSMKRFEYKQYLVINLPTSCGIKITED